MDQNRMTAAQAVDKILSLLPGTDCCGHGGCGKPNCRECAKAIVSGDRVALCPAVKQETVDAIAEVLEVPSVEVKAEIAFVCCNGDAAGKKRLAACKACEEAVEMAAAKDGGPDVCTDGCVGIGSCIDLCTFDAMALEDGKVLIDPEKCTGCRACASEESCPRNLIVMLPAEATNFIPCASTLSEEATRAVCGFGCIGCGDCEEACPEGAIAIVENHAVIDYEKCAGCVACTVKCKKKIVIDTLHDLTVLKENVAFVKCSGDGRVGEKYKREGIESCQEAVAAETVSSQAAEAEFCESGCRGQGDCTKVCRYDAIHLVNGVAKVDPEKCVGCEDCTYACPKGLIEIVPYKGTKLVPCSSKADYEDKISICGSACIACEDCKNNCPNDAIYMEEEHAAVDPALCENCQICQYMCPRNIIVEQTVPEYNYIQRDALGIREGE